MFEKIKDVLASEQRAVEPLSVLLTSPNRYRSYSHSTNPIDGFPFLSHARMPVSE
jgi:hypothetical protein